MRTWIRDELATCDLGDARLNSRYGKILNRFDDKPSLSIPAACRGRAEIEAAYRFFDNDKVTPAKLLAPHRAATIERTRGRKVVMVAQDSTEIDFTRRRERVGGPLDEGARWGLLAHPHLVFAPDGLLLGGVGCRLWARDPAEIGKDAATKRRARKAKTFADKESARWLEGYQSACALADEVPGTQVVSVADSEADIYECLAATGSAEWIVRSCQDRALADGGLLREKLHAAPVLGSEWEIIVSRREPSTSNGRRRQQPRDSRLTRVEARALQVTLRPPQRPGQKKLSVAQVNVVLVREINPPEGEEPIEWMLLTTLPIATAADVRRVVDYYKVRWGCEVFFRTLKSGCGVEELQLETAERMMACIAVYLVVAWRVLYLMMLGRQTPDAPCHSAYDEAEWRAVQRLMSPRGADGQPTLGDMTTWVAMLGGYIARKRGSPPGPKAMWVGLQRVRDLAAGYDLAETAAKKR